MVSVRVRVRRKSRAAAQRRTTDADARLRQAPALGGAGAEPTKPTFGEVFRYRFDNVMARGPLAIVGLLGLVTFAFIFVLALVIEIFRLYPGTEDFGEILWQNMLRALDSGTFAGDSDWGYRIAGLIVTLGGIFVVASLIGIISSAFDSKVEELRKGSSAIQEKDHTLILGWSEKVFPIIGELLVANESRRRATIVVLADDDKVEMDDAIRAAFPRTGRTRIITRSGDPMRLADLALANPNGARSIIILATEEGEDADSSVIKTALAITNNPHRRADSFHIVGELRNPANVDAARLVGRHEAHWVLGSDLISRITVQSCRQSGLSVVYTDLLDFDGDEIYFATMPELVGRSYGELLSAFSDSCVIGLVRDGAVLINPDSSTVYGAADELILIAEDDSLIAISDAPGVVDESAISAGAGSSAAPERTLILGYNSSVGTILRELGEYVAAGSSVTVVSDVETPRPVASDTMAVEILRGDTTNRALLESLDIAAFDHIIVLAYKQVLDVQRADAKTLITLLHLRDIADRDGLDLNVVSEMLDDRNRELAEVTQADDFIVSDKLISLMLSQVSENKQLTDVFDVLFSSEGSEVYLKPATDYVVAGVEVNFYTVVEAARRRGETAVGYRVAAYARSSDHAYGVALNPRKAASLAFTAEDRIIVLAES